MMPWATGRLRRAAGSILKLLERWGTTETQLCPTSRGIRGKDLFIIFILFVSRVEKRDVSSFFSSSIFSICLLSFFSSYFCIFYPFCCLCFFPSLPLSVYNVCISSFFSSPSSFPLSSSFLPLLLLFFFPSFII